VEHLIPSLAALLEALRPCFRAEAFFVFRHAVSGWLLCLGRRTLTEVWQHAGLSASRHFSALFHLFAGARWGLSDLGLRLAALLASRLAPDGRIWLVVDDTLCHKRGEGVAFGGIFLDPVLSSKRRKAFRFGVNQVVLGLAVRLPWRPDRCFCLPLLVEPFRKKGAPGHVKKTQLAARMAARVAALFPGRDVCLVGDSAYVNAATLRRRPANLHVLGPVHPKAALYAPPAPRAKGQKGRPRLRGERLPAPREMFDDPAYPASEAAYGLPGGERVLRTQDVRGVLWYTASGQDRQRLVLVRDPSGKWRDLALLCTDPSMGVADVIEGYCRRWSIELTFHDCKQHLGLSEPMVRKAASVERAHAMAYVCYSLAVLWYGENRAAAQPPARDRPWYRTPVRPAFAEMLGTLRLALWRGRLFQGAGAAARRPPPPEILNSLLHHVAAVR
jgi:hypothetical protein